MISLMFMMIARSSLRGRGPRVHVVLLILESSLSTFGLQCVHYFVL